MGKGLVVSAMLGNRSSILPLAYQEAGVDYLMYTDAQVRGPGWKVEKVHAANLKKARLESRKYKWHLGILPEGYDSVVWCDSTHTPQAPLRELVEDVWLKDHEIAAFPHPLRDCTFEEVTACGSRRKDTLPRLERARRFLVSSELPAHSGLFALGTVARRVCERQHNFGIDMITLLRTYTPRDQLFFTLLLRKHGLECHRIQPGTVYRNEFFRYDGPHG